MFLGLVAVIMFSLSLPMTRLAVPFLGPDLVSIGRTALAGLIALSILLLRHEPFPHQHIRALLITGISSMLAYPVLTSIALQHVPAAHGAVIVGFMPALTAFFAVIRAGERPSPMFWTACGAGAASVVAFAIAKGAGHIAPGDLLIFAAAGLCSFGYAEGACIARLIGGWRVVFWAQTLILPITLTLTVLALHHGVVTSLSRVPVVAWMAFAELVSFSALIGFLFWYMGLARGGVARIGQLQLLQLPLSCWWSVAFLGEHLDVMTIVAAVAVVGSALAAMLSRTPGEIKAQMSHWPLKVPAV